MRYTIPAKPTRYADTCFRSRLEARWAAFFDLLRWPYVYEPFDLDYWSPDFLILGACKVLVEVKPILRFSEEVAAKMEGNLAHWIAESGAPGAVEPLLLGACPFMEHEKDFCMGWCAEVGDGEFEWAGAVPGIWSNANPDGRFGYCHAWGSFSDRITGGYDGGSHGIGDYCRHWDAFKSLWAKAGNLTQWKYGARRNG
jgi:hypothetical protein